VYPSLELLTTAYRDLAAVLGALTVEEGWEPTGSAGWTPVDLGFHLLSDARRALAALNTPAAGPADATAARRGTGREPLDARDLADLGAGAERFPLFG
jgi:hypothetical protein